MSELHFPGAVGLTHLQVYTSTSIDGLIGGSPHMHLTSAEAYVPTRGSGEAQTFSADGLQTHRLEPGRVVWFEPGIIHRLVNSSGDLEILAIMQNAGLPEAGDAVFTFPDAIMADADQYAAAASLPEGITDLRYQAAQARRDLAITGFHEMLAQPDPLAALNRFLTQAIARKRHLFERWSDVLREGTEAESQLARQRLDAIVAGSTALLRTGRQAASDGGGNTHTGIGMCGLLQQFEPLAH
jgi:hypothetical protein